MCRILFVEDNEEILDLYKEVAKDFPNVEAHFTSTLGEASNLVMEHVYDIALCDYHMHNVTTEGFAKVVKSYSPSCLYISCSGGFDQPDCTKDIDEIISKPLILDWIQSKLKRESKK